VLAVGVLISGSGTNLQAILDRIADGRLACDLLLVISNRADAAGLVVLTVHFVDEETDHGPIIIQGVVAVAPDDTEESLRARILAVEHESYPAAIQLYAEGRLEVRGRRVVVRGPHPPLASPIIRW
jgi:folate-dependent phosphoribosylglycinamide formyltransferase PurN